MITRQGLRSMRKLRRTPRRCLSNYKTNSFDKSANDCATNVPSNDSTRSRIELTARKKHHFWAQQSEWQIGSRSRSARTVPKWKATAYLRDAKMFELK